MRVVFDNTSILLCVLILLYVYGSMFWCVWFHAFMCIDYTCMCMGLACVFDFLRSAVCSVVECTFVYMRCVFDVSSWNRRYLLLEDKFGVAMGPHTNDKAQVWRLCIMQRSQIGTIVCPTDWTLEDKFEMGTFGLGSHILGSKLYGTSMGNVHYATIPDWGNSWSNWFWTMEDRWTNTGKEDGQAMWLALIMQNSVQLTLLCERRLNIGPCIS